MVTLIKHTIPSEEADQIHLGDGTETLSTRIWINNKPLLLHNIYRVDGELDITTPLTREPRSIMVGDFNARDEVWCRYNNRAGRQLNEQLRNLDNFCLMNHPQVWTTIYNTAIDLSLVPVDFAPLTNWSIYPGLLSDHLAVQLEIQHQHIPERVSVPKRWLTQHADWKLYRERITTTTTNIEWTDVDTNETNITKAILEAAEVSIPKSSGKTTATPYWKNNMGIRMAKHIYNSKLKAYRRHTSPTNLEHVQTAYKEYTKLCTHVRNQSWNQWITDCNTNINSAEVWRRIKAAKGTAPRPPTHPRPQEEADLLCAAFAQRTSSTNLPEHTNTILTNMAPERVRTITTATYEAVSTDQEFTISELEEVLHRLKDSAPGDDTVCYSMLKNVPLATKHLFLRLINQSFSEGRLPTRWKMAKIIPIPKKDKTHRPISLLPALSKVMERLVLTRVKWSAQPVNPYSLGFRSGVGTIDAIATLIHKAAPITTLRSGYKSRSTTIFLDLEKAFELVSKEVLLESAALLGIRGQLLVWLDDYLTNRTGTVQFQGKKSKCNHMTNGTPQGSSLSPTLFNMVINRLLQLDLGGKIQMIAYADDLAIHGGSIGEDKLYEQMTTALKKIETKSIQLGLKFSPDKCEALWYRSNNPDWNFKIAGEKIPWRASVTYLGVVIDKRLNFRKQVDYVRQKTDRKMNLLKVLNSLSDVNARILKNIYSSTIQSTLEYGAVTFGMMAPCNIDRLQVSQNQGMRLILGVPRGTSGKMMRHELQMLPVEHRAKLTRAKLYRKIRRNTQHPLHTTINRRQRNGWTTEIQECHRLVSRQLDDPTQLEIDNTAPWEQLPYDCRIDWTKEGTEVLKQRSLEYIRSQPDDNTYYTDGSSDGTRVAAAVVHKTEEIIIRLNDSATVLDAEMTAIQLALENVRDTEDTITIHTDSLTAVNTLRNRKQYLNTITSAIRDAASRLTRRPTINWIPAHTGIPGNEKADHAAKRGLQLDRIHTIVNTSTFREQTNMKEQMERHYKEKAYNDASQKTMDHRRLQQTVSSRRTLMTMPRKIQRSIWRLNMRCPTYSQVTTRQPLRCRWCDEDYYSITEHWLRHCPAMMYWQELMMDRLNEHEVYLDDRETVTAILNSQNAVAYEEITGLLRQFPLPEPNS